MLFFVADLDAADAELPGGIGGATACGEVDDVGRALATVQARGARRHRGPVFSEQGARAAKPIDPFGNTFALHRARR